jgi:ubiquinone/menaquinone biosynthesis C-methylase UbiE
MLAYVEQRAAHLRLSNVELVQAGFLSYEHTGPLADFVYTRHALHQIPDFWKAIALQRMVAILKPRGILRLRDLFLSCALDETHEVIEAWLANAAPSSDVGWTRAEYETHLRDEFSTFTWLFEPMLTQAGFEILEAKYSSSHIYTEYTCRKSPS